MPQFAAVRKTPHFNTVASQYHMKYDPVILEFLDSNKVLFKYHYQVSQERLWNALSNTAALSQWFMKTEWDFREGGRFKFEGGWEGWIEALREFEFIQFNSSTKSFTRFDLKPMKNGAELQLTDQLPQDLVAPQGDALHNLQPGGQGTHWVGLLAGWDDFLLALEHYLANKEIEDHFDHLCLKYKDHLEKKYGSTHKNTSGHQ